MQTLEDRCVALKVAITALQADPENQNLVQILLNRLNQLSKERHK